MEFIDHTGHVFSLPTYDDKPVAIQYSEGDYIFWIKDNPVSIDNYYILPIRFILSKDIISENFSKLIISLDSKFYSLIGPKYIQQKLELNKRIDEPIEFNINDFRDEDGNNKNLTLEDFYFDKDNIENNLIVSANNKDYILFPFYVIANSKDSGTYLTNITIKYSHNEEETEDIESSVHLTRDELYDYLMKETMSDIKIYKINKETNKSELWHTIPAGYNPIYNEIITKDQTDMTYRIHNWMNGILHDDVYHFIYRFPKEKWLEKGETYYFSGIVKKSCNYCGSPILINHDGGYPTNNYQSLLNPNGIPYYTEDYEYDSVTDKYTPKYDKSQFMYGTLSGIYSSHAYGDTYYFIEDRYITPETNIRDISFDIDNKEVVNNKDGGTITTRTKLVEKTKYTQITVGCTFIDECEELIINGKNLGINLPKDIIKAIYQSSFYNKYANEELFKTKMKELLLNYMSIKGECGNFKSIINSLKWFGWADKVEISKLLKTDNEFQNQFILDYFDITNDLKETYKYFTTTNLISLSVKGNQETGKYDEQFFNKNHDFIGEGKPLLEDLFDKTVYTEHDSIKFYKPYYDFMYNELALKLDCLAYYYQRYFLPIHLKINKASIEYKVYANTVKHTAVAFEKRIEKPIFTHINSDQIYFSDNKIVNDVENTTFHEVLFYKSIHYIDNKFNEFSNYSESTTDNFVENENGEYVFNSVTNKYIKLSVLKLFNEDKVEIEDNEDFVEAKYFKINDDDDTFNNCDFESKKYSKINEDIFYVNENCITIPISIEDKSNNLISYRYGEYLLIDDEYIKPYKFFIYDAENGLLIETNDYKEATHCQLYYADNNYTELSVNIERFTHLTEGYFNCKIFLYRLDENNLDENNSPKEIPLINDNVFSFYQSIDQYYCNYIIIPRLIKDKSFDWLNTKFKLSLLMNNKWYNYYFIVKTPNILLDFGKLSYKYLLGDNFTMFDQIEKILDDQIRFKSFMYQPDLVTIDTLFYDKDSNRVLTFLEKLIETNNNEKLMNDFYYKYFANKITVPYNKKYYNRIHLLDLYEKTVNCLENEVIYNRGPVMGWMEVANYLNSNKNKFDYWMDEWGYGAQGPASSFSLNRWVSFNEVQNNVYTLTEEDLAGQSNAHGWQGYDITQSDPEKPIQIDWVYIGHTDYNGLSTFFYCILSQKIYDTDGQLVDYHKLTDETIETAKNSWFTELSDIEDFYDNAYFYNQLGQKMPVKLMYTGDRGEMISLYHNLYEYDSVYKNYKFKYNINEDLYDVYLMHDNPLKEKPYWYIVLISKYPIASYLNENILNLTNTTYDIGNYVLKYNGYSIDKFLVNRMDIIPSNGMNHFNSDDIIIGTIGNNNYQFNIDLSSKWEIKHITDQTNKYVVKSNTNTIIIPNNNTSSLYSPGYYNVKLNYSINGLNDQQYETLGRYRVNLTNQLNEYPQIEEVEIEKTTLSIEFTITDFGIAYEKQNGERIISKEILDPELGYKPFALKILNKRYFDYNQEWSIFMGLKALDCNNPDNGYSQLGREGISTPQWGFLGTDIEDLKSYEYICYDETQTVEYNGGQDVYFPTDRVESYYINTDGTYRYPADSNNRRGYNSSYRHVNILNSNDTINWNMIDKNRHAAADYNGYENTQIIINNFDPEILPDWRTVEKIRQGYAAPDGVLATYRFSPLAACAWRYHTQSTQQGDWYIPAYAELIFVTYNFQRLTDKFTEINALYPDCCKADLFTGLAGNAVWSSTERNATLAWEIHPGEHAHSLSKATNGWWAVPYIRLDDKTLKVWGK